MKTYIVKWWVPFPSSEYGGLVVVRAKSKKSAEKILRKKYPRYCEDFPQDFAESVEGAISVDSLPEGYIKDFIT